MIFRQFHVFSEKRTFSHILQNLVSKSINRPGRGLRSLNKQNRESALPRGGTGGPEQGTGGPEQGTGGPEQGTGGPEQGTGGPEQWTRGPERARTLRSLNKQNRESALPRGGTRGPEQGTGGPEQRTGRADFCSLPTCFASPRFTRTLRLPGHRSHTRV